MRPGPIFRRRLLPSVVLAILAHLLVLLAMGLGIPRLKMRATADVSPAVVVVLERRREALRPTRPTPSRAVASTQAAGPRAMAPEVASVAPAARAADALAPLATQPAPRTPAADNLARGDLNVRNALRGLTGCGGPLARGLIQDEQAACDQRLVAARPSPVGPAYSAAKLAQFASDKKDPIFVRKPHNGCLPRIGAGRSPPRGSSNRNTTVGVGCALSF